MIFRINNTNDIGIFDFISLSILPLFFLVLTLCSSENVFAQQPVTGNKIVVLFDTNALTPWKRGFSDGFGDYIDSSPIGFSNSRVAYEFLGLSDFPLEAIPNELIDMLKLKQQIDPAATVVAALPQATDFLFKYGDQLYPGIPKIYAIPSAELVGSIELLKAQNAGVLLGGANTVISKTLAAIPQLLPDTKHIYVISGSSQLDFENRDIVKSFSNDIIPSIEVTYLTGLLADELFQAVVNLPDDSAILMLTYQQDRQHAILRTVDVMPILVEHATAPIFTPFDFGFVEGVVGGKLTNSVMNGRQTAELTLANMAGLEVDPIAPLTTAYVFDHRQLQRWGIDERLLPPDSIIENRSFTFVELYAQQLILLSAVLGMLLFFVVFLKRQANDLGKQKILFESVIGSIPDAILLTDTDANIFAANGGASEVFDFGLDELVGMSTRELIDPAASDLDTRSEIVTTVSNCIEPRVLTYKKTPRESFPGETIATKITSPEGETLGHFALIRDISKRLSMEEEQRQGQKMEALGNLVGGISHDFNNVLGVISGYAELSLMYEQSNATKSHLGKILKATDRAKSLVGQIMSFSRDTGSEQKPTDLTALLGETMKLLKVSISSHIEIIVKLDETLQPIMGSEVQIQQIVMNLATNAYQAMKSEGGILTISAQRELVNEEVNLSHGVLAPGSYSVLMVTDNGPGMSSEVASRVFEPFFTTKEAGEGSGMGMAIVYKLVKAHGALVDLRTAPGIGTRIMVYFRELAEVNAQSDKDRELPVVKGGGERILLVDDEKELLDSAQQLLSGIGYRVEAFCDPSKALEAFRRTPEDFDLLVTDENMPKITGVQLVKAVRKLKPHFPAIICTGYSEVLSQGDVERMNLDGVVRKPFTLEELSRTISNALTI